MVAVMTPLFPFSIAGMQQAAFSLPGFPVFLSIKKQTQHNNSRIIVTYQHPASGEERRGVDCGTVFGRGGGVTYFLLFLQPQICLVKKK